MTTAQDTALAFILDQYRRQIDALSPAPSVPGAKGTKVKAPKVSKPRTPKANKGEVSANAAKPATTPHVPQFAYPANSVGAEGFFSLLRKARCMADERNACNAYLGYSDHEAHGTQVDNCRRAATLALNSHLGHKTARSTVAGYIKGMPQTVQRDIDNLLARERGCAEELATLHNRMSDVIAKLTADTLGNNEETNLRAERDLTRGLLLVSEERLQAIRNDLRQLHTLTA